MLELPKSRPVETLPEVSTPSSFPYPTPKRNWRRGLTAISCLALGTGALILGGIAIKHRFSYLVVDNGLVNGRVVRLRAPIDSDITAFYAEPGIAIQAGQVLAQLQQMPEQDANPEQDVSRLQGNLDVEETQLSAARQQLRLLQEQLTQVSAQTQDLNHLDTAVSIEVVNQKTAALQAAESRAQETKKEYERFSQLEAAGALSTLEVDRSRSRWETAQAQVIAEQANLRSAQTTLVANQQGIGSQTQDTLTANLTGQRIRLTQAIHDQQAIVDTLTQKLAVGQQQVSQLQTVAQQLTAPTTVELQSPINAVVYSTDREQGEQVTQAEPVLSLLDCNNLWVETLVSASQAHRIDATQPAQVKLAGYSTPLAGQVNLMQPISGIQDLQERRGSTQVQALVPAISPSLVGQPLVRVTVRISPPPGHEQAQRFCGVGQVARVTFAKS